jgi:hypothetical protein
MDSNFTKLERMMFYKVPRPMATSTYPNLMIRPIYGGRLIYTEKTGSVLLNITALSALSPNVTFWARFGGATNVQNENFLYNPVDFSKQTVVLELSRQNFTRTFVPEPYFLKRIEYIRLEWFIVACFPYALNLILSLIFCREQPLKSRGIIPVFSSIVLFIHFFIGILPAYILDYVAIEGSACYIYYLIQQFCALVVASAYILHYLRFLTMFHLNLKKDLWRKSVDLDGRVPTYFKFVKFIGTTWGQVFWILFSSVINMTYLSILVFTSRCDYDTVRWLFFVDCVFWAAAWISIFFYDLALSTPLIKKCDFKNMIVTMWKHDGFYFRLEQSLTLLLLIPLLFAGQITVLAGRATTDPWANDLAAAIINFLLFQTIYFISCGFTTYLTVLLYVKSKLCRKKKSSRLETIISDPEGYSLFEKFCMGEYSAENLWITTDISMYCKNPTREAAQRIYYQYLRGYDAEFEVNVARSSCQAVKEKISHDEITVDLFDHISREISTNLCDTFSRFEYSYQFLSFQRKSMYFNDLVQPLIEE